MIRPSYHNLQGFSTTFVGSTPGLLPIGPHALAGLVGVPELRRLALVHMIHFQHRTVRQQVAAAELRDKGPADDLRLEVIEKRRVDVPLDLFPRQPAARLEAEDVVGLAAAGLPASRSPSTCARSP